MAIGQRIYISVLALFIVAIFGVIMWQGYSFYRLPMEDRFFHPAYDLLKPGGAWGHGFGIAGTLSIIIGIVSYMTRKRMRSMARLGVLRYWLEFHIFLCTLGPILILYHTSFKFGGLVAVSFWSMVAVFLSGIIGRFIYIQIPRTIEGRELSLAEVRDMKTNISSVLSGSYNLDEESLNIIVESTKKKVERFESNIFVRTVRNYLNDRKLLHKVRTVIRKNRLKGAEARKIIRLVRHEISLNRKIDRLLTMQKLFKYWHVAHFPFAIVMLLIMAIHVTITIIFGYRWIF